MTATSYHVRVSYREGDEYQLSYVTRCETREQADEMFERLRRDKGVRLEVVRVVETVVRTVETP